MSVPNKEMRVPSEEFSFFSEFLETHPVEPVFSDQVISDDDTRAAHAAHEWFRELLDAADAQPGFGGIRQAATRFLPEAGRPVFHVPLAVGTAYRLSLLGIHRLRPVPLHDHPHAWSAQFLLSGRIHVRHFDPAEGQRRGSSKIFLRRDTDAELGRDAISNVTPTRHNIHGMEATTSNAVMLSIQRVPASGVPQSLYFPVDALLQQRPFILCHRVTRHVSSRGCPTLGIAPVQVARA